MSCSPKVAPLSANTGRGTAYFYTATYPFKKMTPQNSLIWSSIALFICPPLGIPSFIFSFFAVKTGDKTQEAARESASYVQTAPKLNIAAIVGGLLLWFGVYQYCSYYTVAVLNFGSRRPHTNRKADFYALGLPDFKTATVYSIENKAKLNAEKLKLTMKNAFGNAEGFPNAMFNVVKVPEPPKVTTRKPLIAREKLLILPD
jgi:hypothetical protein